jgi:pyruvate/2-oxoglutarate dehydrogenase complex dihydrolipoamide dehydrogenase (E3) component
MGRVPEMLPQDKYNAELVANAHPPDWKNPAPAGRYNLVVIGGGTAGLVAAAGAAGLGAKVALVERRFLGGDCLTVGCVPSKCLIRSSRAYADARDTPAFGVKVRDGVQADFAAAMERMRRLRAVISRHDAAQRFRDMGVDVFLGEGRFVGPDAVEVVGQTLRFKKAVIATGARAVRPDVPGLEEAGFLTNETVFSLTERPPRLAVFGAGPLGCELAQALRRLGSEVTIVERSSHILPREDPDAAEVLDRSFQRDGIVLKTNSVVKRVTTSARGKLVWTESKGAEEVLTVDEILVGAGRAPNVQGLNLEAAGVGYDERNGVHVDDTLRTTNPRIYAAGDVCLRHRFTHTADASARIVVQNALFWGRKKLSALVIPWCTYTDPEIAHVGICEQEAKERGIRVTTFFRPFKDVDRAIADGEEEGFAKIHLRKGTDRILGATIVARHAGEMISEVTLAMVAGVGLKAVANVIHPYPTQAECIRQVADAYNRTRLTPFFKRLTTWLMAWRR